MQNIRILIADDHLNVRTQLAARLSREPGFEVVGQASNGRQAMELALSHRPHLILIDPLMRDQDGLEALGQISRRLPEVTLVVLTAYVDTSLHMELRRLGVAHILMKGLETDQLMRILRQLKLPATDST